MCERNNTFHNLYLVVNSELCELELNGEQFRVHHEVEIVKSVVSFAHAQVDFALILAYNQYDKIDKWSGAYLSNRVS